MGRSCHQAESITSAWRSIFHILWPAFNQRSKPCKRQRYKSVESTQTVSIEDVWCKWTRVFTLLFQKFTFVAISVDMLSGQTNPNYVFNLFFFSIFRSSKISCNCICIKSPLHHKIVFSFLLLHSSVLAPLCRTLLFSHPPVKTSPQVMCASSSLWPIVMFYCWVTSNSCSN